MIPTSTNILKRGKLHFFFWFWKHSKIATLQIATLLLILNFTSETREQQSSIILQVKSGESKMYVTLLQPWKDRENISDRPSAKENGKSTDNK